jgi:pilus assembly protein Flp/PilA
MYWNVTAGEMITPLQRSIQWKPQAPPVERSGKHAVGEPQLQKPLGGSDRGWRAAGKRLLEWHCLEISMFSDDCEVAAALQCGVSNARTAIKSDNPGSRIARIAETCLRHQDHNHLPLGKRRLMTMLNAIRQFVKEEEGASAAEYALLLALITVALGLVIGGLSGAINGAVVGATNAITGS